MSEKRFEMDIFSFEQRPRAIFSAAGAEPYFPYADAWKEFDKLQKTARGREPLRLVLWIFELSISGIGIYGLHLAKGSKLTVIAAWGAAVSVGLLYQFNGRRRFLRWGCPRCHSEWPGTKTEKDRACKACGLRLHQMSP